MYSGAPVLGAYIFTIVISSSLIVFLLLCSVPLHLLWQFYSEIYHIEYGFCYSSFLLISICMEYLFHPLNFNLYMSLGLKWVSYWQHIYESCFCIHSAIQQVLITMIPLPLNLLIRVCYCRSFILLFFLSREFPLAFVINLICY